MNETQEDFMEVAGADDDLIPDAEVAKAPLKLTPEILKRDQRKTDIVEIDLSTGEARVVERSKAPKLTKNVLKEKGAPIQTVEIVFDGQVMEVEMRHGKTLEIDIAHNELLASYKDSDLKDPTVLSERDIAIKHLLLPAMITNPIFSQKGEPAEGYPIEECSQILLNALWQGYVKLNYPIDEDWYQVQVLRGVPLDVMTLIGKSFELFPSELLDDKEISVEAIEELTEKFNQQRSILVASMILNPIFSYNGEGSGEHPYPVENLSENMLGTLFNAYRVVNVPKAGYDALRRFPRTGDNGLREVSDIGSAADG